MKILFTSANNSWNALLDSRFGRAKGFVVYDDETDQLSLYPNKNIDIAHGAGPKAAQFAIDSGASVLITGHVGPTAFDVLKQSDIKVYNSGEGTLKKVYEDFQQSNLKEQV